LPRKRALGLRRNEFRKRPPKRIHLCLDGYSEWMNLKLETAETAIDS
jgi:hypothetical protein